jgi:hypothetical protein
MCASGNAGATEQQPASVALRKHGHAIAVLARRRDRDGRLGCAERSGRGRAETTGGTDTRADHTSVNMHLRMTAAQLAGSPGGAAQKTAVDPHGSPDAWFTAS